MARRIFGRGVLGVLVASGAAALLFGCNLFGPSSYRYKMTIEVDTPQGVKAFSSVRAVRFSSRLIDGGYNAHVRGEAVIMDLPGGTVFALLSGANGDVDYAGSIGGAAMRGTLKPGGANRDYQAGQFAEIYPTVPDIVSYMPKNPLPMFVRFKDIRDPKSVEKIDPADLAASFGAGVRLKRVTVAVTLEKVTSGIEKRLGWLGEYYGKLLNGERYEKSTPDLSGHLGAGDFSTELSK
jgi:hypothetical protein